MLSDEQLAEQLRSELAPLRPPGDLAERVRQQAHTKPRRFGRIRSGARGPRFRLRLAGALTLAAGIVAIAIVATTLQPGPKTATPKKAAASTTATSTAANRKAPPTKKAKHVKTAARKAGTAHSAPALPTRSATTAAPTTASAPPPTTPATTPTTAAQTAPPPATQTAPPTTANTPPPTKTTHHKSLGCPPYCGY